MDGAYGTSGFQVGMRQASQIWRRCLPCCVGLCLCGCAGGDYRFSDHAALVLRPTRHQAALAFSFGAEPQPGQAPALAKRSVAAVLSAAMVLRDDEPISKPDGIDFKGDRLFLHLPRSH